VTVHDVDVDVVAAGGIDRPAHPAMDRTIPKSSLPLGRWC
jgi:hypothetical protein